MAPEAEPTSDRILHAAFTVFSAHPLAESSMAQIAEAAGVSRPALYQYFEDKNDIYRAMLEGVLAKTTRRATDALDGPGGIRTALVGFVEAIWDDDRLWRLSRHQGHDLVAAKAGFARPVVEAHYRRLVDALRRRLIPFSSSDQQLDGWIDMVRYCPIGFGYDRPTRARYRRRLGALAAALADSVEAAEASRQPVNQLRSRR